MWRNITAWQWGDTCHLCDRDKLESSHLRVGTIFLKINDLIRRRNEASSRGHANKGGITKTVTWCKANITQRKIGGIVYKDKFDVILITQHQWAQGGEGEEGFSTCVTCRGVSCWSRGGVSHSSHSSGGYILCTPRLGCHTQESFPAPGFFWVVLPLSPSPVEEICLLSPGDKGHREPLIAASAYCSPV